MLAGIDSLAGVTGFDVVLDVTVHFWPVCEGVDGGVGSFDSLVASDWCVVVVMEDLGSKFASWDAKSFLIIDEIIFGVQGVVSQE